VRTQFIPPPAFPAATDGTELSRPELLAQIQSRLAQLKHIRREPSSPGGVDDRSETLADANPRLLRTDLLKIRLLLAALANADAITQILEAGRADRRDPSTEFGGALAIASNRLRLTVIPPMFTGNDMEYIASDRAMAAATESLAMFHMHFARADSSEDAGPSAGDLRFAATHDLTCVVFTSLSESSFDVDYYTPGGAVVDLGIYALP
ncbi:MAG TPA: hypothetical protein VHM90_06370, partial [Phycisphaerae bacterium]|nr:hypothetical protein [Phycisphaerae bacterium]